MPKQNEEEYTGRIKIIKLPEAGKTSGSYDVPPRIRAAWLGPTFACYKFYQDRVMDCERDEKCVTGGGGTRCCQKCDKGCGVFVRPRDAIQTLEMTFPEAAQWWREKIDENSEEVHLFFKLDEIEVLENSVNYPGILELPEEAQGQITR